MRTTHLFSLVLSASLTIAADTKCWFPDKVTEAKGDVPCYDSSGGSHCCGKTDICLSNGYCMGIAQPFVMARASCSDKNWGADSTCKDPCSFLPSLLGGGCSLPMISNNGSVALYCASAIVENSDGVGCVENHDPFTVPSATVVPNKAVLASSAYQSPLSTSSSSANSSSGADSGSSRSSSNNNVAIGAGVGVPLGVLAITAITWALWERRKRYLLLNSPQGMAAIPGQQYDMGPAAKYATLGSNAQELAPQAPVPQGYAPQGYPQGYVPQAQELGNHR
ncbi:hypothetical protein ASPWEDRAFT_33497 [Aspergillus wentii DTO 134E9]|uniref:Mid2 domain-containing protein n=1 Tax=Aspergillus wentii DTO 134E9 TaxID=1073089 RepID=A0A1L9RZ05_ASPWE|nr:uncharacterized protein ASPWEDRAFT_33497 [Aspergillus wentii DTO 134E9]KAI9932612.1 hypothetical protein MW887_008859 [Aspergillus wentii]OJJ40181.1 hypothetical protein ASPWEDRAFT_33497 [Aspergillus wentii DTO 134E9]